MVQENTCSRELVDIDGRFYEKRLVGMSMRK